MVFNRELTKSEAKTFLQINARQCEVGFHLLKLNYILCPFF